MQERDYMQFKQIALVLVSGAVFTGCSLLPAQTQEMPEETQMMDTNPQDTQESMVPSETTPDSESVMVDDAAMKEGTVVELVADDFTFGQEEIRVKQGEKLTVSVMNKHGFHDFVIDELAVNSGMIAVGDTMEIEIPTDQPGTYEYYCSVGKHRENGMRGMLIIE